MCQFCTIKSHIIKPKIQAYTNWGMSQFFSVVIDKTMHLSEQCQNAGKGLQKGGK